MKCFVILIVLAFASKNDNDFENADNSSVVKIEEDEYTKTKNKSSVYIGVTFDKGNLKWNAIRRSKTEKKLVYNGNYKNEETAAHASDTLARKLMANTKETHTLNFPDDYTDIYHEKKTANSNYIGVYYIEKLKTWLAARRSKNEKNTVKNGTYRDEETAARASDTLARKLIENGERHKLNFPDDKTEVHQKAKRSKYFGVSSNKQKQKWTVQRYSKTEKKNFTNGVYRDEETAAHASDTLARKLFSNGQDHKLNFPDKHSEVYRNERESNSKYIGVSYNKKQKRWFVQRWNKTDKKSLTNGSYRDEETAAHASDTLVRKLIANGERHKLNFPDDTTEVRKNQNKNKRKQSCDFGYSQGNENNFED